jgi:hypothetical protein
LQEGGEQDAVTDPEPGSGVERLQEFVHPGDADNTPGWEAVHVKGMALRMIDPFVLGKELFPITSVMTAVALCEVPLEVTKVVWPVCWVPVAPTSSEMFWTGQLSKKSRGGDVVPWEFWYCGCRKDKLVTPLAEA